ncbi:hypothetical protein ACFL1X_01350 [Candidatus Hydrogenedentota bacterium]
MKRIRLSMVLAAITMLWVAGGLVSCGELPQVKQDEALLNELTALEDGAQTGDIDASDEAPYFGENPELYGREVPGERDDEEQPERPDRPDQTDRPERPDRPDQPDRPDDPGDDPDRPDRPDDPGDDPDRPEDPDRTDPGDIDPRGPHGIVKGIFKTTEEGVDSFEAGGVFRGKLLMHNGNFVGIMRGQFHPIDLSELDAMPKNATALGVLSGKLIGKGGKFKGHVRGIYGKNEEGKGFFAGKLLNKTHKVKARMAGHWVNGEEGNVGRMRGRWAKPPKRPEPGDEPGPGDEIPEVVRIRGEITGFRVDILGLRVDGRVVSVNFSKALIEGPYNVSASGGVVLEPGMMICVTGVMGEGGVVLARVIRILPEPPDDPDDPHWMRGEITGVRVEILGLKIGGKVVSVNFTEAVIEGPDDAVLEAGMMIAVAGVMGEDGVVIARVIRILPEDRPDDPEPNKIRIRGEIAEMGRGVIVVAGGGTRTVVNIARATVRLADGTAVDKGELAVGQVVGVVAILGEDGVVNAALITIFPAQDAPDDPSIKPRPDGDTGTGGRR